MVLLPVALLGLLLLVLEPIAYGLLSAHLSALGLLAVLTIAQAIAHSFAVRRYLITAVAATVLGLLQAHMLNTGAAPLFALFERIADTLIGAALAWAFCYVLPSWERGQIPALVARVLTAQGAATQVDRKIVAPRQQTHAMHVVVAGVIVGMGGLAQWTAPG